MPSQQPRKPIGIVTRPGNVSDDGEPCESGPGHTGGLSTIMTTEAMMPKAMPASAPVVLKRRQVSARISGGKFALAANTKAMLTSTVTLKPEPTSSVPTIAATPTPTAAMRATLRSASSSSRPMHVGPQVVRDRARRRDHEAGDDREDRREGRGREQRERDVAARGPLAAAEALRQQRRGQVAALADGLLGAAGPGSRGRRSR